MFGFQIPEAIAYCGWRAILSHGHVDTLPDRQTINGDEELTDMLIDAVNQGAWKRMLNWAKTQSGSSREIFDEDIGNNMVLRASPQASYGYLYIGLALLPETNSQESAA